MTGKSFHIHNCIYPNSMCISSCAGSQYHNFPADFFADKFIGFMNIPAHRFNFWYIYSRIINCTCVVSVAIKKGKSRGKFFVKHHLRIVKTHLFQQLLSCFYRFVTGGNRQCETDLGFSVIHGVTIGFNLRQIQCLVKIIFFG